MTFLAIPIWLFSMLVTFFFFHIFFYLIFFLGFYFFPVTLGNMIFSVFSNSLKLTTTATTKVQKLKSNMSSIEDMLSSWNDMFCVASRAKKPYIAVEFVKEFKRLESIAMLETRKGNQQIHKLLHDSNRSLKISKGAQPWIAYIKQTSRLMETSLGKIVVTSLENLLMHLGQSKAQENIEVDTDMETKDGVGISAQASKIDAEYEPLLQIKLHLSVQAVGKTSPAPNRHESLVQDDNISVDVPPTISFDPPLTTRMHESWFPGHVTNQSTESNDNVKDPAVPLERLLESLSVGSTDLSSHDNREALHIKFPISEEDDALDSFGTIVLRWVQGFFTGVAQVKRLEKPTTTYLADVLANAQVRTKVELAQCELDKFFSELEDYRNSFTQFEHLWCTDKKLQLQAFLEEHSKPSSSPDHIVGDEEGYSSRMQETTDHLHGLKYLCGQPPLNLYEEQFKRYTELHESVSSTSDVESIGWVLVDAKPLKDQIRFHSKCWITVYAHHLSNALVQGIDSLESYIKHVTCAIEAPDAERESIVLIGSVQAIRSVKNNTTFIDNAFDAVFKTTSLLDLYGFRPKASDMARIETAPDSWRAVKHRCKEVKGFLRGPIEKEIRRLCEAVKDFTHRVGEATTAIQASLPTNSAMGRDQPIDVLESLDAALQKLDEEKSQLNRLESLFEVPTSTWPEIQSNIDRCRLLRGCWDMVGLVQGQIEDWRGISWDEIDADSLLMSCKDLQKKMLSLPRGTRVFGIYDELVTSCKNMLTSLPLVQELRDDAVKRHHWGQLMRLAGCKFDMDGSFTLGSVLNLNLHAHQDDVLQITEQARQERKIERQLDKISDVWGSVAFEYEEWQSPAKREGGGAPWVLKPADDIVEILEDHLVTLQNLSVSKYIAPFRDSVDQWKTRLSGLDSFLTIWLEVQRSWQSLESIFCSVRTFVSSFAKTLSVSC